MEAKELLDLLKDNDAEERDFWEDFLSECFVFDGRAKTRRSRVHEIYLEYCKKHREEPETRNVLYQQLGKAGIRTIKADGRAYFQMKEKDALTA